MIILHSTPGGSSSVEILTIIGIHITKVRPLLDKTNVY